MAETNVGEGGAPVVQLGPALKGVTTALALALTLGSLAWAADLLRMFGILLFNEQHLAIALALALPLLYLSVPAREGPRTSVPWYDLVPRSWAQPPRCTSPSAIRS